MKDKTADYRAKLYDSGLPREVGIAGILPYDDSIIESSEAGSPLEIKSKPIAELIRTTTASL